jgi:lipopolysaccharide heptosyltransferase I
VKILILKPSSLGDVVQALPVLRLIKAHLPASEVYWWIQSGLAPLLEDDPDLSGLFLFERRPARALQSFWQGIRAARQMRFDWVIDVQGLSRSAIFGWLANGKTFIGLDNPTEGRREGAQACYDVLAPGSPPGTPASERYLAVLPLLGVPIHRRFEWLPLKPAVAARLRERWSPRPGRWIILVPGARWENKRWPTEHFAETVRRLTAENADLNFAIVGSAADRELAAAIRPACPDRCLDLTGQTSLPEMVEWVRLSHLVISNDTGPMHVAAALGKPLLAIFGPTNPARTGPHGQMENVLQVRHLPCVPCLMRSCHYHEPLACMWTITPEQVCARAKSRLG